MNLPTKLTVLRLILSLVIIILLCFPFELIGLQFPVYVIDSIKIENDLLNKEILLLSDDLDYYKFKVDSLKQIKQRVIIKTEYVVSENLTEGVKILKENLKWEKQ